MTDEDATTEVSRLLIEAKALIKRAAEIASMHRVVPIPWHWEAMYNHYVYIFQNPESTQPDPFENIQLNFDFGDDT